MPKVKPRASRRPIQDAARTKRRRQSIKKTFGGPSALDTIQGFFRGTSAQKEFQKRKKKKKRK